MPDPEPTAKSFDAMWDAADRVLMPDEELTVTVRKAALVADALIRDAFAELAQSPDPSPPATCVAPAVAPRTPSTSTATASTTTSAGTAGAPTTSGGVVPDSEPLGYAIAEQRPCERCGGSGCDELTVADYEAAGIDIDLDDDDLGTPEYADDCLACNGDGTRWVVTDTRVEPREVVVPSGPTETWWRPTS